jgi:aldehyde dehydrogenase (NAD+)
VSDSWNWDHLYVGGRWVEPAGTARLKVVSPATEELVGSAPEATTGDVDRAVAAARRAVDEGEWPRLHPLERGAALARLGAIYGAHLDDMSELITAEMGSPTVFSQLAQAAPPWQLIELYARMAGQFDWEEERAGLVGGRTIVRHEPVGVVGAIAPWNVPQMTIVSKLAPALLAGCAVVVKPSPETPLDALLLAQWIHEA